MTNQHISRFDSSVIGYSDKLAVKRVSHRPSLNWTLCDGKTERACVETPSSAVFLLSCGARQNNVAYLVALQWLERGPLLSLGWNVLQRRCRTALINRSVSRWLHGGFNKPCKDATKHAALFQSYVHQAKMCSNISFILSARCCW